MNDNEQPHYVYIIGMRDREICKVGISNRPSERLKQLRTGSPFRLFLAHHFSAPSRSMARLIEAVFHDVQRGSRMNGEWFSMSPDKAMHLMALNMFSALRFHIGMSADDAKAGLAHAGFSDEAINWLATAREGMD